MTDTMTPPEPTPPMPEGAAPMPEMPPAVETPGAAPPSVADAVTPPAGSEESPEGEASTAPEEKPTDDGMTPPPKDGTPTFPGQKLKHKGKEGEIEKLADDYLIPLSDDAIKQWAKTGDTEAFKQYVVQVACGMYPTFAPQIQMGLPTRVLLDPYVQVADQVLGELKTEPNWSDPKWGQALQGGTDPKTGRPVPMTLDEWTKFLMQHPGHNWEFTEQAHDRADQFVQALHHGFNHQENA